RVQTIGAIDHQLRQIVPEARISIAHGQMAEHQLADRMEEFSAGQIDVLLTTTIIESGLDIPNANTLIVDRADTFGLAQLYQLRGRVGRGAQRAYAYFFRHKKRSPTLDARQRLETIAENTQLGAGFSIAMRDLEIRGAGDILGTRQHGHIAAVGFHLYTRLLADAVQRLQGSREAPAALRTLVGEIHRPIINVDLPIPVGIPADYIEDQSLRLRLYRRLADIRALDEIDALSEEFNDRFGSPPEPVLNFFYQLRVKILAEVSGLESIGTVNRQIVLRFTPVQEGQEARSFPPLAAQVRMSKNALWLLADPAQSWRNLLLDTLYRLQPGLQIPA
ncbi:MAG TPA: TRCF domain-containing protein, partial [Anaerolineales bacterium]|nr:TRCF domain-containing protein [Anaerolineales bacterium]